MASEELCFICDNPTGRAGASDDSIYWFGTGPWCEDCSDALRKEVEDDTGHIADLEHQLTDARSRTRQENCDIAYAKKVQSWWCERHGDEDMPNKMPCPSCLEEQLDAVRGESK